MTKNKKSNLILVGKDLVGIVGLEEIFKNLYHQGKKPNHSLKKKLLSHAKKHNYIPSGVAVEYQKALLREYGNFYEERKKGLKDKEIKKRDENKKELYQGMPREQIPWFPTVYEDKCNGCKECFLMCPTKVFLWDDKTEKPKVVKPFNCVVGCTGCAHICKPEAISFPSKKILENIKRRK